MSAESNDLAALVIGRQLEAIAATVKQLTTVALPTSEPQSSVELVQNAKGATQIAVKVYSREPEQAAATAQRLYDELAATYRVASSADNRGGT